MYTTFIRPLLEYASVVWDGCSSSDSELIENELTEILLYPTN